MGKFQADGMFVGMAGRKPQGGGIPLTGLGLKEEGYFCRPLWLTREFCLGNCIQVRRIADVLHRIIVDLVFF